ncbi:unnamed protein product [Ectocarpus sp. 6 AP-2014]
MTALKYHIQSRLLRIMRTHEACIGHNAHIYLTHPETNYRFFSHLPVFSVACCTHGWLVISPPSPIAEDRIFLPAPLLSHSPLQNNSKQHTTPSRVLRSSRHSFGLHIHTNSTATASEQQWGRNTPSWAKTPLSCSRLLP